MSDIIVSQGSHHEKMFVLQELSKSDTGRRKIAYTWRGYTQEIWEKQATLHEQREFLGYIFYNPDKDRLLIANLYESYYLANYDFTMPYYVSLGNDYMGDFKPLFETDLPGNLSTWRFLEED